MEEKNYDQLRRALDQLPEYDAPDQLWNGLDAGLNKDPEPSALSRQMPGYSPPSSVWNELNAGLDADRKQQTRLRTIYRWTAGVAAAVVIFAAGFLAATYDAGPQVTYVYTQEANPNASFTSADWNDAESSFDDLMARLAAIDEPALNALRLELEELNAAKADVEAMLEAYGQDAAVIRQLADIETERSRVYRLARAEI